MRVGIDARKIADFGIGTYIRGLLGALAEIREDDHYLAFAPKGAPIPQGIEHVIVDAPHYSVRELVTLGRAANAASLDLFHAPHYVVPFTRVPVIVTIHDLIHLHQPLRNPLARLYAKTMLRRAVRKARVVLTVSDAVRHELESELGARNVIVTPNGIDAEFFADGPKGEGRYFLYAGNDKPHKNVGVLLEAFAKIREQAQASLVLTGARFRGGEGVIAPGFVGTGELAALYRGALAVVMPSSEEGFGLPAAEAMACGAPVITSRAAALVELTGDAALHVDVEADALAETMLRVAQNAPLRSELAANGRARAARFTWSRCAAMTRHAYRTAR
ncbi:MAG TPA: glycosyltransferase family 1 protein [Thermoanaerobaculia bacterium]|jgi:glycosyltransferase involved in cell wall biosynthesis